ncbi:MCP four helix bundle domain-containing protein, partial [Nitrosomonas europaea]
MTIKSRLIFIVGLLSLALISVGSVGLYGLYQSKTKLETIYQDRVVVLGHFSQILDSLLQVRMYALLVTNLRDTGVARQRAAQVVDEDAKINELWRKFTQTYMTPEEQTLAGRFTEQWKIYQAARNQTLNHAINGNFEAAVETTLQNAGPKYEAVHSTLMQLIGLQESVTAQEYEQLQAMTSIIFATTITLTVLG